MEKWGCGIWILTAILFGTQRYILFSLLPALSPYSTGWPGQLHRFLFGAPPYSVFDVLLGFQVPDEGLLFLFQLHNLLIALVQAVHTGINYGLAYLAFWLVEQLRSRTYGRPWLRASGCLGSIGLLVVLALAGLLCFEGFGPSSEYQSSTPPPDYAHFSDPTFRIEFDYPSTMVPQTTTDSRVEEGIRLSSITVRFVDRREVTTIFLQAVEDPTLTASPDWYPPSELQLRIFAAGDVGILSLDRSPDNDAAIRSALDAARQGTIAGFPSIQYRVFLNDSQLGYIYLRGSTIVSPARSYTLMAIGGLSAESPVHQPVKPERVDQIWETLLRSLSIEQ